MPGIEEVLASLDREIVEGVVAKAVESRMKETIDIYDDFIDDTISNLRTDRSFMSRFSNAVADRFITSIEAGDIDVLSIGTMDALVEEVTSTVVDKIRLAINSL